MVRVRVRVRVRMRVRVRVRVRSMVSVRVRGLGLWLGLGLHVKSVCRLDNTEHHFNRISAVSYTKRQIQKTSDILSWFDHGIENNNTKHGILEKRHDDNTKDNTKDKRKGMMTKDGCLLNKTEDNTKDKRKNMMTKDGCLLNKTEDNTKDKRKLRTELVDKRRDSTGAI
jgi:hypothetical protein